MGRSPLGCNPSHHPPSQPPPRRTSFPPIPPSHLSIHFIRYPLQLVIPPIPPKSSNTANFHQICSFSHYLPHLGPPGPIVPAREQAPKEPGPQGPISSILAILALASIGPIQGPSRPAVHGHISVVLVTTDSGPILGSVSGLRPVGSLRTHYSGYFQLYGPFWAQYDPFRVIFDPNRGQIRVAPATKYPPLSGQY